MRFLTFELKSSNKEIHSNSYRTQKVAMLGLSSIVKVHFGRVLPKISHSNIVKHGLARQVHHGFNVAEKGTMHGVYSCYTVTAFNCLGLLIKMD